MPLVVPLWLRRATGIMTLVALPWSTAQATSADVRACPEESVIDSGGYSSPPFQQEVPPENSFAVAHSLLEDYGKQLQEQWEKDRKQWEKDRQRQEERLQKIRSRWDEYGKKRCKESCYDTYRSCAFFTFDRRSRICQHDFDNCMKTCE